MALSLKHAFQSALPDSGDAALVQPSNWNDEHDMTTDTGTLLGDVDGKGNVGAITVGSGLSLVAGELSATASGGGLPLQLPIRDAAYYSAPFFPKAMVSISISGLHDTLIAIPFPNFHTVTWEEIGVYSLLAGEASADVARLGLYADNGGTPEGGALILDAGEIAFDATEDEPLALTIEEEVAGDTNIWLAMLVSAPTGNGAVYGANSASLTSAASNISQLMFGRSNPFSEVFDFGYLASQTYGALPATFPAVTGIADVAPYIWLRTGV